MSKTAETPFEQLFTVKQAASLLRDPPYHDSHIRRLCIQWEIGRIFGRDRLLTTEDLDQLKNVTGRVKF